MAKQTGKKRGRPRKPVFEISLAAAQAMWEPRLRRAGNPREITTKFEVSAQSLWTDREPSGRKIRPTKVTFGESSEHRSFTQETDPVRSLLQETAADVGVVLSPEWQYYLEYMDVVAEELSPKDKGAELKKLALEDARSRRNRRPPEFPVELGIPAEFKARLAGHELEIRLKADRRKQVISIRVYQLPPDENEDLDPSEEPAGHWGEGLTWIPDPPK